MRINTKQKKKQWRGYFVPAVADTKLVDNSHQYNVIVVGAGSVELIMRQNPII
jgi:hypothetical protein